MKREFTKNKIYLIYLVIFINILFLISTVDADSPTNPVLQDDYERMQENIDRIPLNPDGEIDKEKLNASAFFISSKAEERINNINVWIEENVSWLRFFFRMVPEVSWLFFWVVFIMIVAFTHLILNGPRLWAFSSSDFMAYLYGIGVFFILLFSDAYLFFARFNTNFFNLFFNYVLYYGIWIALALVSVVFLLIIALLIFAPQVFMYIFRWFAWIFGKKIASSAADRIIGRAEERANKLNESQRIELEKLKSFNKGLSE
jgi:hypothetical protein